MLAPVVFYLPYAILFCGLQIFVFFGIFEWENYIQTLAVAVLTVCATYAVHQLINWILLKDEKNAPSKNQSGKGLFLISDPAFFASMGKHET